MEIGLVLAVGVIVWWLVQRNNATKAELARADRQQKAVASELTGLRGEAELEWDAAVSKRDSEVASIIGMYREGIPRFVVRHARDAVALLPRQQIAPIMEHQDAIEGFLSSHMLSLDPEEMQEIQRIDATLAEVDPRYSPYKRLAGEIDRVLRAEQRTFDEIRESGGAGRVVSSAGADGLVRLKDATAKLGLSTANTVTERRRLWGAIAQQGKSNRQIFPDVSPWIERLAVLQEVSAALERASFKWPPEGT
jgi:hypothetical protein